MGRKRRQDLEGAWHHVMHRSAGGHVVFRTRSDGELFERLLGGAAERFGVDVHAYCLMPNHFHLLVHCPSGGLSDCMQLLLGGFTRAMNRRLASDGAIFRGRFHSIATDDLTYVARIGRYIHENPLDIKDAGPIETYRWSSLRCYVDPSTRPPWLRLDVLPTFVDDITTGSPALSEGEVSHIIDLLIASHLDLSPNEQRAVSRAVHLDVARRTGRPLPTASPDAARAAAIRAERLLTASPEVRRVASIALRLLR